MAFASKIVLTVAALGTSCILYDMAKADDVPDALSVEWQGQKPCEKLFDDEHVRVVRCTFAPGAVHVCHSHPGYLSYVVNGGQGQIQDEKGIRKIDVVAGALLNVPPTRGMNLQMSETQRFNSSSSRKNIRLHPQ